MFTYCNITTFRLVQIYLFGNISHIQIINNLPIHIQYFTLYSKSAYQYMWTLDKFPNFTNFTELKTLDISGCNVIDTDSFVNSILPPNITNLNARYNKLTGKLDFSTLFEKVIDKTDLTRVMVDNNDFNNVNFIGIGNNTHVYLDGTVPCDPNGYFMFKDDKIGNPNIA